MIPGVIARKVGMSRVFLPTGEAVAVTYLKVEDNTVVRTKTKEKDGYDAVVLGVGPHVMRTRKGNEIKKFKEQKEFKVASLEGIAPGATVTISIVPVDSQVTVTSTSKGKGFQGVMKRHGFHGGPGSHGSHFKREPGSVGMRGDPGRIFKGHRMSGHMGDEQITIKNRPVMISDAQKGVLAIKGPVPGSNGSHVYLTLEAAK